MHFIELSGELLQRDDRLTDFLVSAALDSDKRFFGLIRENVPDYEKIVRRLILDHQSDLHGGLLAVDPSNGNFAGLMVSKSLREISLQQFHSLRDYNKAAAEPARFRAAIKAFATRKMVPSVQELHYLARLYIAEAYRGTGLSEDLISRMFIRGHQLGVNTFGLHVDASNGPAIRLYQRAGFTLETIASHHLNDYFYMERNTSQAGTAEAQLARA
jgi:ribosomal protein S18 acetylase RimI-like enzyme